MNRFAPVLLLLLSGCLERPGRRPDPPDSTSSSTGGLCIVPPVPPGGILGGNGAAEVKVRVDRRDPVVLGSSPITMRYLSASDKHLIAVYEDGKQAASFTFTFEEKGSQKLCLFQNGLYRSWQLWDQYRAAAISPCTCVL